MGFSVICNVTQILARSTRPALLLIVAAGLGVAGCGLTPPETGLAPSSKATAQGYPPLLDSRQLAAANLGPAVLPEDAAAAEALAARLAALQLRAASLQRPVMDPRTRSRLESIMSPF